MGTAIFLAAVAKYPRVCEVGFYRQSLPFFQWYPSEYREGQLTIKHHASGTQYFLKAHENAFF